MKTNETIEELAKRIVKNQWKAWRDHDMSNLPITEDVMDEVFEKEIVKALSPDTASRPSEDLVKSIDLAQRLDTARSKLDEKELEDAAEKELLNVAGDLCKEIYGDYESTFMVGFTKGYRYAMGKLHRYETALKTLAQTEPVAREALEEK